jgi:type II secretory pathway pseudopilin PulG
MRRTIYQARRSGFTLIELIVLMLLIVTVLGMGVPALFASERKSYVNQAMNDLLNLHQACMAMQRELAARGDGGVVTLTIENPTNDPRVRISVFPATINPETWLGRTLPISISAEQFIAKISSPSGVSWSYQKQTGFIASDPTGSSIMVTPIVLTFNALLSGSTYKVARLLTIYPEGYSDIP